MNKIISELTGPFKRSSECARLPTHPILGKTALTGYSGVASVAGPDIAGLTTKRLLQFKDPIYPLWYEYNVSSLTALGVGFTYQTDLIAPSGNPVNPYNAQIGDIYSISTSNTTPSGDTLGMTSVVGNWTGLAGTWPMMVDDKLGGAPFIYVPSNFNLSVAAWLSSTFAGGGTSTGTMMMEFWVSPGETDTQTVAFTEGGTGSPGALRRNVTPASTPQWVRPRATSLVLAGAGTIGANANIYAALFLCPGLPTFTFPSTGNAPTFGATVNASSAYTMLPVPEAMPQQHLTSAVLALDNVMMHSSHVVIENVTKVLNKEGIIDAARLNVASVNPWATSASSFAGIDPAKRYTRAAEHGLQCHVDPTAEYDRTRSHRMYYNFKDAAVPTSYVVMHLSLSDCFNLVTITDADASTAGTFFFRYSAGWEFLTTSTLYETAVVDLRRTPLSMADQAMNVLAMRCPFRAYRGERQELSTRKPNGPRKTAPRSPRQPPKKPPARQNQGQGAAQRPKPGPQGTRQPTRGGRGRPAEYPTR